MAVLGRLLVSSAERLDLPDLLSIDSYAAGDWKYFLKGMVGDTKPFILRGFDIIDPGNAIGTQGCSIRVADSVVFYPGSNSGSFFHGLQENHPQAEPLVPELRKNAVNYVYLTFSTFNTSVDTRAFWDPDKDGGVGGEFTQDINTESVLKVEVNVSTGSFPANTIPVAKVTVGPVVITAIEDARDMMFRLGTGGINPNPFNTYGWRSLPAAPYQRNEPPTTMMAGGVNPFQGADKNILTLKEWMDAIMSKLRELGGTTYWYDDTSSFGIITNFFDAVATAFKSKGKWIHDTVTPGLLTWSEDIQIKMTSDPRTYIIRQGSRQLDNEQVMYIPMVRNQPFNTTDESVSWTNGQPYINTIGGAVGLFTNLSKGDYVKKANDTFDKFLRVEEFYDAVNLGGSTTTAALARSVRLSSGYLGTTGPEKGRYDKGVYLASDLTVSDRDEAAIGNTGGNFHWLAIRSDTIENVGNAVTTTLALDIDEHDGSTARVTSTSGAHGLVDGDRVTISGTTNFDGTYKVEVETSTIFYITLAGGPFADESGAGHYATITTVARNTPYGFQEESANHGFNSDDTIIIDGTTNYDGSYEINVRSATSFTIPVDASYATETTGTATLARVIVRTEGSVAQLIQGQIIDIGGGVADNIRQYLGMKSLSETAPSYAIPPAYNTLDGMQNYNGTVNENVTDRLSKVTAMMADKAQDKTLKYLPSNGITSINNTTNGAAQEITVSPSGSSLTIATPGSDGQAFIALPDTTPGISLLVNQAAYVTIDRNNPTTPSIVVADIVDVPVEENTLVIAVRLNTTDVYLWEGSIIESGGGVPAGFLTTIVRQNNSSKVIEGGTWSMLDNAGTYELTLSTDAYVQIPGLANTRNTIQAQTISLPNASSVAYVQVNRIAGAPANLTVSVGDINTLVLTDNITIIARRVTAGVLVGQHSFLLKDGEYLELDGALAEINRLLGQLRIKNHPTDLDKAIITGAETALLDGATLNQIIGSYVLKFEGAVIDFTTGEIFEADGTTPLGIDFTPFSVPTNEYFWMGISLEPGAVDTDNTQLATVLVDLATAADAVAADAPKAVISGTVKLGSVQVFNNGGNIEVFEISRLGVGAGSSSAGASPKVIGGGVFTWDSGSDELSFTDDMYLEVKGLEYSINTIPTSESPITLPNDLDVAYVEPNTSGSTSSQVIASQAGITGSQTMDTISRWHAQTFTPANNSLITSATITIARTVTAPVGNFHVEIYTDGGIVPGSLIGAATPNDMALFGTGFGDTSTFTFASPVAVSAGTLYWMVMRPDAGATLAPGQSVSMRENSAGSYPGGQEYVSVDGGSSYINLGATYDFAFSITADVSSAPSLAVVVDTLENVPDDAVIIARRVDNDVIVGSSSTRLTNGQSSELYAQESIQTRDTIRSYDQLSSEDTVTWTGSQLEFTTDILIQSLNTRLGVQKDYIIEASESPIVLADGELVYAAIDREAVAGIVTPVISSTVPTPASDNFDIVVLFRREDNANGAFLYIPLHKQILEPGQTVRLGASGSGEGGDGILEPMSGFKALSSDKFDVSDTNAESQVQASITNATYNAAKKMYALALDKSKTVSTNAGTAMTISGAPTFTVVAGDIVYATSGARSGQWRRIATVNSQTSFVLDTAFTGGNMSAADTIMVSQAVWTVDLVNAGDATEKTRPRDFFSGDIETIGLDYFDSLVAGDDVPDFVDTARISVAASNDGLVSDVTMPGSNTFSSTYTRDVYPNQIDYYDLDVANTNKQRLFLVFFPNPTNVSVTALANLLGYEASFYGEDVVENGGTLNTAYCYTNGSGTEINCSAPTIVGGKTRIPLTWSYVAGVNSGQTKGQVNVILDGQTLPRYVAGTTTDAYYTEVTDVNGIYNTIELNADYSGIALSVEIRKDVGVVDTNNTNVSRITALETASTNLLNRFYYGGSTVYNKNPDAKYIVVRVIGAGGGGGGAAATGASQGAAAGGGGGGACAIKTILNSAVNNTETVTIGNGGTGVSGSAGNGGGTSSFGAHCSAGGGNAGNSGGASTGYSNASGGTGGTAVGGDINLDGNAGGNAMAYEGFPARTGAGGASAGGFGGSIREPSQGLNGLVGINYGSGGSGSSNLQNNAARTGGAGSNGLVIVEEYG